MRKTILLLVNRIPSLTFSDSLLFSYNLPICIYFKDYIRATCIVMVAGCGLAVTTQADAQFPGHASVSAEDHQHTDTSRK